MGWTGRVRRFRPFIDPTLVLTDHILPYLFSFAACRVWTGGYAFVDYADWVGLWVNFFL